MRGQCLHPLRHRRAGVLGVCYPFPSRRFLETVIARSEQRERRGNLIVLMIKRCYVYILTNESNRVLYTGVTADFEKRLRQHREGGGSKFAKKYKTHKLVHVETFSNIRDAIAREKQIKAGSRADKIALIERDNPEWRDLSEGL